MREASAIALAALAGGCGGCCLALAGARGGAAFALPHRLRRLAVALGRADRTPRGERRLVWPAAGFAGTVAGFGLLGVGGAAIGCAAGPFAAHYALARRRARRAARIDGCVAEFALALAAALAGGHSVRGALLASARATPEPLAGELDRLSVDLALGMSLHLALAALRLRTGSARIESLCGAIELHGGSGGDLVTLARELAAAFRARDLAKRDARSATAQARFTALIVAAIPLTLALVAELVGPGSVSGAFAFAPSAVMMVFALLLLAAGCVLCARIGRVE
ncbi:MAG: type II secretion system F family protein [Solirubrobacterales bacterium]